MRLTARLVLRVEEDGQPPVCARLEAALELPARPEPAALGGLLAELLERAARACEEALLWAPPGGGLRARLEPDGTLRVQTTAEGPGEGPGP